MGTRKIFMLSFDDGTIYDGRFVELLNKYHIPCTFNLNTGLEDFVWYFEGKPVQRQKLAGTVEQYRGHEIASHTRTHPLLTELPVEELVREVREDCDALRGIFGVEELGFAVPFTGCGEREVAVIRDYVRYIRHSDIIEDFALPADPYHIHVHGFHTHEDIRERIAKFAENTLEVSHFVLVGHSYEFEMLDQWDYIEELLKYIKSFNFEIMTVMDFVREFYA